MNTRCIIFLGLIISLTFIIACGPTMVTTQVNKPAEINVKDVKNIAIVDFSGPENSGSLAASLLTTELLNSQFFHIFERSKIDVILEEHKLAQSGVIDESTARQVGQLLGVDALIFGEVVSFNVEPDQTGTEKVEKKVGTGKYREVTRNNKKVREEIKKTVLVDQNYRIRRGTVAVTFRTVNIETGELIASKAVSKSYDSGKLIEGRGNLKPQDAILNDLMSEIVKDFSRIIAPYIVTERLALEAGKGSIQVGVQYARNGLWDEAINAFKMAVNEQPKNSNAHYNLGISYQIVGDFDNAEEEFNKAIALKNKNLYFRALSNVKQQRLDREKLRQQVGY